MSLLLLFSGAASSTPTLSLQYPLGVTATAIWPAGAETTSTPAGVTVADIDLMGVTVGDIQPGITVS